MANNSLQYHIPSTIYRLFLPLLLLRNITELNSIRLIFLLFSTLLVTIRAGIVSPFLPKEDGYKEGEGAACFNIDGAFEGVGGAARFR